VESLGSSCHGLLTAEALRRLQEFGRNELQDSQPRTRLGVLLDQVKNPLLLLLVFAAAASFFTGQWMGATIVLAIVVLTVFIGYSREYQAESAAAALKARVRVNTTVLRDGKPVSVPIQEIVPGDVVFLSAGTLVPGDGIVLGATDCFISEAVLTGESFPVEKIPGAVPADTPQARRRNSVFSERMCGVALRNASSFEREEKRSSATSLIGSPCVRRKQYLIAASSARLFPHNSHAYHGGACLHRTSPVVDNYIDRGDDGHTVPGAGHRPWFRALVNGAAHESCNDHHSLRHLDRSDEEVVLSK
jgi:magnesium-transporting ATPase (P-type)